MNSPGRKRKLIAAELTPATPLTPSDAPSPRQSIVLPSGLVTKYYKPKVAERKVLEEDIYIEKLGSIIQRDYFPDIPKLKAQTEYLEALQQNDVAKIRLLQQRYSTHRTDRRTSPTARGSPDTFETPRIATEGTETGNEEDAWRNPSVRADSISSHRNREDNDSVPIAGLSVDKFLNKYNSEDNASFTEQIDLDREKMKNSIAWMYKAESEHNKRMITHGDIELKPADEQVVQGDLRISGIDNWRTKAHNALLYYKDEAPLTEEEQMLRNASSQHVIVKKNTRLAPEALAQNGDTMNRAACLQAAVNRGKVDPMGNALAPAIGSTGMIGTPSPAPGVADSPLMTWGQIEGTPFLLDASDTPVPYNVDGPQFKIPEVPLRDKLAHEMMDTIGKRFREKKKNAQERTANYAAKTARFGSARSTGERLGSMSPAARRLATAKLGIRLGSDKALKASYTPSPVRRNSKYTPSPSPSRTPDESSSQTPQSSITDNLLNLPNKSNLKPKAGDYF